MTASPHINTKTLPMNVFDLQQDDFYRFVERQCGPLQAEVLKFQLISDASIFIECNDPIEIMQYNSEKLHELKMKSCLITIDGSHIVLPGITASFQTLKKCLLKRTEEDLKESKRKKNTSDPLTSCLTSDLVQSESIEDLRNHIINSIDKWLENHRDEFDLRSDSALIENIDYFIEFSGKNNALQNALITCSCGSKSTLARPTVGGHFQVSLSISYLWLDHLSERLTRSVSFNPPLIIEHESKNISTSGPSQLSLFDLSAFSLSSWQKQSRLGLNVKRRKEQSHSKSHCCLF